MMMVASRSGMNYEAWYEIMTLSLAAANSIEVPTSSKYSSYGADRTELGCWMLYIVTDELACCHSISPLCSYY